MYNVIDSLFSSVDSHKRSHLNRTTGELFNTPNSWDIFDCKTEHKYNCANDKALVIITLIFNYNNTKFADICICMIEFI